MSGLASERFLIALQDHLLDEGASKVSAGSRVVYSTCSIESDENSQRIQAFLEPTPGFRIYVKQGSRPASAENGGPVGGGRPARLVR